MTPEIRKTLPAPFATTHRWALQHPFQLGPLGTVMFRAAARGTTEQITVQGLGRGDLFGGFRLALLVGHASSVSLLRRAGSRCRRPHRLQRFGGFLTMTRVGEAQPTALAAAHRGAPQHPFLGGAHGAVVCRAAASRTVVNISLRGIGGGHLIFIWLGTRIGHSYCPSFLRKPGCVLRARRHG